MLTLKKKSPVTYSVEVSLPWSGRACLGYIKTSQECCQVSSRRTWNNPKRAYS